MFRIKQYAVFFCAAFLIGGCSLKPNVTLTDSGQVLPDYRPLLQLDQPGNTWEDRNQAQIPPVQIYMDNTGSMEGFIFDEIMNDNHADPKFVHMMRAFREMENTFFKPPATQFTKTNRPGGFEIGWSMGEVFTMILIIKDFILAGQMMMTTGMPMDLFLYSILIKGIWIQDASILS